MASASESRAADHLGSAREIARIIEAEAGESEARAELSPRVLEALREAKIFWVTVPRE
jgi:hypothetical protein